MKKRIFLCLVSLMLTFAGCTTTQGDGNEIANEKNLARIAELEAELKEVRADHDAREAALEDEIKLLKAEIEKLTGKENNSSNKNESTGAMVFHYKVENGGATITSFEGTATLVEIPATLDGHPVTKIGERAFEGNTALGAVVIPAGVLEIDWFAFYDCTSLFEIKIPDSVSSIGHAVFDGCNNVTLACSQGSYAESYAKSYGLSCIAK